MSNEIERVTTLSAETNCPACGAIWRPLNQPDQCEACGEYRVEMVTIRATTLTALREALECWEDLDQIMCGTELSHENEEPIFAKWRHRTKEHDYSLGDTAAALRTTALRALKELEGEQG